MEVEPDADEIPPRGTAEIRLYGLTHAPTNRTQGAMAAWIVGPNGSETHLEIGDLHPPEGVGRAPAKPRPEAQVPGLCLLPWPVRVEVETGPAPILVPADQSDPAPFAAVAALHRRLFPAAPAPLSFGTAPGVVAVELRAAEMPSGGYVLRFGTSIVLEHGDADGLRHGLITLAQMAHATREDARFAFPVSGSIEDAPRHGWRGCHLDVARNVRSEDEVKRLLDVMAWQKMNRFHCHLTDDEGYRLPFRAFPALNDVGAGRGGDAPLPSQYADGPAGQAGHYTHT